MCHPAHSRPDAGKRKKPLRLERARANKTTLDHSLPESLRGFALLLKSPFLLNQAAFMLLMTWIATILNFLQIGIIARTFSGVESRTIAFADVDLFVNI